MQHRAWLPGWRARLEVQGVCQQGVALPRLALHLRLQQLHLALRIRQLAALPVRCLRVRQAREHKWVAGAGRGLAGCPAVRHAAVPWLTRRHLSTSCRAPASSSCSCSMAACGRIAPQPGLLMPAGAGYRGLPSSRAAYPPHLGLQQQGRPLLQLSILLPQHALRGSAGRWVVDWGVAWGVETPRASPVGP